MLAQLCALLQPQCNSKCVQIIPSKKTAIGLFIFLFYFFDVEVLLQSYWCWVTNAVGSTLLHPFHGGIEPHGLNAERMRPTNLILGWCHLPSSICFHSILHCFDTVYFIVFCWLAVLLNVCVMQMWLGCMFKVKSQFSGFLWKICSFAPTHVYKNKKRFF